MKKLFSLAAYVTLLLYCTTGIAQSDLDWYLHPDEGYTNIKRLAHGHFLMKKDTVRILMNAKKEELIISYDKVSPFDEDRFLIEQNKKLGLYHWQNGEVIAPQFDYLKKVNPTLLTARKNNKTAGIDYEGNIVFPYQQYGTFKPIGDHLVMTYQEKKWVVFNLKGEKIEGLSYIRDARNLGDNRVWVMIDDLWGLLDNSGKIIVEPQFKLISLHYANNMLWAQNEDRKWGAIDSLGHIVIPFEYDKGWGNSNDGSVVKKDGFATYINLNGEFLFGGKYNNIETFGPDRMRVTIGAKYGCIDSTGHEFIPPVYDRIVNCAGEYLYVKKDSLYGFMNSKGEVVLDFIYDEVHYHDFDNDGLAIVKKGKRSGLMNKEGVFVVDPQYGYITMGAHKFYTAKKEVSSPYDLYTPQGKKIETPRGRLRSVAYKDSDFAPITFGNKSTFIHKYGSFLCEPIFDYVDMLVEGLAVVRKGEKWGILRFQE